MSIYTVLLFVFILCGMIMNCVTIDCFRCTSFGGKNPWCEDPFHNNYSTKVLQSPCWAGRKGRDGLYPATACIKLNGKFENGESMVVRDCALDSGSLTIDTELVRMSHCGGFFFDTRYVRGCVQSCFQDACNKSYQQFSINITIMKIAFSFWFLFWIKIVI